MNKFNYYVKKHNRKILLESRKEAKRMVQDGKITQDQFDILQNEIDPTEQKKYMGWLARQLHKNNIDLDEMKDTVREFMEEYNVFAERGSIEKDINKFKTFEELRNKVTELNESGGGLSQGKISKEYTVFVDNKDIIIIMPHNHSSSIAIGRRPEFNSRNGESEKECKWCTTYNNPGHWRKYFYQDLLTFYYIKAKLPGVENYLNAPKPGNSDLRKRIHAWAKKRYPARPHDYYSVAIQVDPNGRLELWSDSDSPTKEQNIIDEYLDIIGYR